MHANVCVCAVFRVDLFCSGKVDGEAVLTIQLNMTMQTNNYTVLNFKRRKMCYKSESPKSPPTHQAVRRVSCSIQTVSVSPGVDPDSRISLPTINNTLSRPAERKHHQHHVNPLHSPSLLSPPTRPRPLRVDKVHVSQNISAAEWVMSEKPEGDDV